MWPSAKERETFKGLGGKLPMRGTYFMNVCFFKGFDLELVKIKVIAFN